MPFTVVKQVLTDFRTLGAKSLEITGGGNPLLYRDGDKRIADIVDYALILGYRIGIITNSHNLTPLNDVSHVVDWVRVSLAKLDEGKTPQDYVLGDVPDERVGWSYIIHERTTADTIRSIGQLIERFPRTKFVRLAGDCLKIGTHPEVMAAYAPIVAEVDKWGKFFIKDIGEDDVPHDDFCAMGVIRPYVAPAPHGEGEYRVYACTSHVLQERTYNLDYSLCCVSSIIPTWRLMNDHFKRYGYPYAIRGNQGCGWGETCSHCFYANNNRLLDAVAYPSDDDAFA